MIPTATSMQDLHALEAHSERDRAIETAAMSAADAVFCVTDEELNTVRATAPDTAAFRIAYARAPRPDVPGFEGRRDLLFFGGFMAGAGSANEDGVLQLVHEVMPHLWVEDPDLRLHIVGADPTPAVRRLHGGRVDVVGGVDDPTVWFDEALVHVAPTRFGAGLKLKLVDTAAAGLPFVTSTVGAEGFALGSMADVIVAEEPAEIARLTWELCSDRGLWERAQRHLLGVASELFSPERFRDDLSLAMSRMGMDPLIRREVGSTG